MGLGWATGGGVYGDTGATEMNWEPEIIHSGDARVDLHPFMMWFNDNTHFIVPIHQQRLNFFHWIYLVYCTDKLKKMKSRFPWNVALHSSYRAFFELSLSCFQASWPVYPHLQMWQWALDTRFTLSLAISQIISTHTHTLRNLIRPANDDSTDSVRLMKHVVCLFKDPTSLNSPMIRTIERWFTIFQSLIRDPSVPCTHSTIAGLLCIITIMISQVWHQTSVNHQFYYIYYYDDI